MDESQHPARKQFLALFYNPTRLAALPAVAIWIYIWAVFSSVWIKILCSLSAFLPFSFVGWGIHSAIKYGWTHPFTVFAISFVTWLFVIAPVLVGICSHLAQSRMKLPYMVLNGIFLVPLYGLVMNILSAVLIWRIWPVFDTPVGGFALFSVFQLDNCDAGFSESEC